jgi:hypothetical protein
MAILSPLISSVPHPVVLGQIYALNPDNIGCEMEIVQVARATPTIRQDTFQVFLEGSDHPYMDDGIIQAHQLGIKLPTYLYG